jgi:hypothetical protein
MLKDIISEDLSLANARVDEQNRIAEFILCSQPVLQFARLLDYLLEKWPQRQLYYLLN